eukprot:3184372-Rhodomonas_salina.3
MGERRGSEHEGGSEDQRHSANRRTGTTSAPTAASSARNLVEHARVRGFMSRFWGINSGTAGGEAERFAGGDGLERAEDERGGVRAAVGVGDVGVAAVVAAVPDLEHR